MSGLPTLKVGLGYGNTSPLRLRVGVNFSAPPFLHAQSATGAPSGVAEPSHGSTPSGDTARDPTDSVRRKPKRGEEKKCIKCREIKPLSEFGFHGNTEDGLQTICRPCKNSRATERRNRDVRARLHHHISTRVASQLGGLCPRDITKTLEERLGYRIQTLVRHLRERMTVDYPGKKLRDALNEGWHVDHIHPLSKFPVIKGDTIDWEEFAKCWAIPNLVCVPADVNLSKGAKVIGDQSGKPF